MPNKQEILSFSTNIEALAKEKKCSCMEAILLYCEKTGLEVELVAKLINKHLKAKLKSEAEALNFLPKSTVKKLPL